MSTLPGGSGSACEKLLSAARIFFYNHSLKGTGIDGIVKRAGVANKNLYGLCLVPVGARQHLTRRPGR